MASCSVCFLALLVLAIGTTATAAKEAGSSRFIFEDLADYVESAGRPDVIPRTSLKNPVNLSVALSLVKFNSAYTETNEVSIDAWIHFGWNGGITFNPEDYNNITVVTLPSSKIWLPDMTVYNGDMTFPQNDLINKVLVFSSGQVTWVPPVKIRFSCNMADVTRATNNTCIIKMGSWVYSGLDMTLDETPRFDLSEYTIHPSYELLDFSAKKETNYYACCTEAYENIIFSLTFRERK